LAYEIYQWRLSGGMEIYLPQEMKKMHACYCYYGLDACPVSPRKLRYLNHVVLSCARKFLLSVPCCGVTADMAVESDARPTLLSLILYQVRYLRSV